MRPLKSLVLAISLVTGQKRVPCAGFAHDKFWSESVARATAARHIAHQTDGVSPYEAFAVGLLSRFGCLALATAYHVAYGHILRQLPADDINELVRRERTMFEIDHIDLTAEMMDDWGLPSDCSDAIRRQNGLAAEGVELSMVTARLAENLHLASSIASVLVRPKADLERLNRVVNEAAHLGIQPSDFHAAFDSIGDEWRLLAAIFAVSKRRVPPLATLYSQAYQREHPTP
jgi:HD-like signal output (HDOD) protein